ncbi:MAG TPA: succinate dehydrogenase/fumarate reductase iron-sulfur subunit [Candidatus Bathyarchaeia archaeon]|nr:succinate dehydrogenase/fumarate reductase iron-sulfur subunit [Candidatus Bathyarchaeia archaeon]
MVLKVFRWGPGTRERLQKYWVRARQGMTVLDALVEVQRNSDPTLAFRYACRVGMCGSCGMVINGRERWACRTLLSGLPRGAVTVRPLYNFPLIRDLVVDMTPLKSKVLAVKAVFVPARRAAEDAGFAQVGSGSRERRAIDGGIECIGCGMCVSACTMVGHDPRFPGPAALNRVFTLQRDSRDGAHAERGGLLLGEDVLARCHGQGNCTDVCPMEISPTDSILALRRRAVLRLLGFQR